ncbi:hypothetical protein ACQY1Q_13270 [Tenacibaculum sp. TC6]|uniref:hypothetical protein n=1 Tax=Tenacibaculum sp. TC6 TaxID=3423223 RepID=UPI003D361282
MRKFVLFVFIAMINVSLFAANENPLKEEIRTNIVKLLGKANFKVEEEFKTTVDFLVNKKGQVVILNIDCNSPVVCEYIKSKLNYKKVYNNSNQSIQVYKMPLRILKS